RPEPVEDDAVEAAGQVGEGAVATGGNIRNDRAHGFLDVRRSLPLGVEKVPEALVEIGRARVEADRHRPVLPPSHRGRRSPRLNDAGDGSRQPRASGRSSWWVGRAVAMRTELRLPRSDGGDRKSTRLNFSHRPIAYALFY